MTNPFYVASGNPGTRAQGSSQAIRTEFESIQDGFDKFPAVLTANKALVVNAGGTAVELTTGNLSLAGNLTTAAAFTTVGAYGITLTATNTTALTLPTTGTLSTLAGSETLTNKTLTNPTINGATISGTFGGSITFSGAVTLGSTLTYGGVTLSASVTGTGSMVLATSPTITTPTISGALTYGGVALSASVTGTGSMVLATSPTITTPTISGALTYGGVTLSNSVTGTGSMVLSASPALTGNVTITGGGLVVYGTIETSIGDIYISRTNTAYGYIARPNVVGYKKLQLAVSGGGPLEDFYANAATSTFAGAVSISGALTYGGVTLSASVTGTGSMVLNTNPNLYGDVQMYATSTTASSTLYITGGASSGYGAIEVGGASGAYIDFKSPASDDFDLRIMSTGTGGYIQAASGSITLSSAITYGGVTLSNSVTGTGSMVLSNGPTITSHADINGVRYGAYTTGASFGGDGTNIAIRPYVSGGIYLQSSAGSTWLLVNSSYAQFLVPLNYGGVTLSNSVSGTGSMVLSASPTLTGTLDVANNTISSTSDLVQAWRWSAGSGWGMRLYQRHTGSSIVYDFTTRNGSLSDITALTIDATGALTAPIGLTLSGALTYGGVTLSNAVTGTGSMVLSASPTVTGEFRLSSGSYPKIWWINSGNGADLKKVQSYIINTSGNYRLAFINDAETVETYGINLIRSTGMFSVDAGLTIGSTLTYGGVTLSAAVTGTGAMVLSAGPTLTGVVSAPGIQTTTGGTYAAGIMGYTDVNYGMLLRPRIAGAVASFAVRDTGDTKFLFSITDAGAFSVPGALTLSSALTYGGVTLSNSVTGTGSMVLSASPTLTGTAIVSTGTLGSSAASTKTSLLLITSDGNGDFVEQIFIRTASSPTDWTTTEAVFRRNVDSTANQGAFTFTGNGGLRLSGGAYTNNHLVLSSAGKVTIGAASGQMTLDIGGSTSTQIGSLPNMLSFMGYVGAGFGGVVLGAGVNGNSPTVAASKDGSGTALPLLFYTNDTERARFSATGGFTLSGALTYGGVTLSNSVTGTGSMVLSAAPTLTGLLTAGTASFNSGAVQIGGDSNGAIEIGGVNKLPYMDWHSYSGGTNDYDVRLQVSGGTGTAGQGTFTITAASVVFGTAPLATPSGSAPLGPCRAWVTWTGGGTTINASLNVSSITRNSAGSYYVNFTTAAPSANYAVLAAGDGGPGVFTSGRPDTTARGLVYSGNTVTQTLQDANPYSFAAFW